MPKMTDPSEIRQFAETIREANPALSEKILAALDELLSARRESLSLDVDISYKVEKFHGEYTPGKEPFEVITGKG